MAILKLLPLASLAVLGTASTVQLPLLSQQPETAVVDHVGEKPLVDSASLQAKINSDNLFARAKTLFNIAKLGEEEYNHPTRVIGSAGTYLYT
jgi:aminopeptidase Y